MANWDNIRRRKLVQCGFEREGPIVYYIPEGGGGFQKSVVYQNFTPTK